MKFSQYQVDAFSARALQGKPSAVYPLETGLDDREPNAETAISFIAAATAF
jgi:predicted PhzF superfamily epimerase YddE/YHI9